MKAGMTKKQEQDYWVGKEIKKFQERQKMEALSDQDLRKIVKECDKLYDKLKMRSQSWKDNAKKRQKARLEMLRRSGERNKIILSSEWCKCKESEHHSYPQDGQCVCGMYKHHCHCTCGKVYQVG